MSPTSLPVSLARGIRRLLGALWRPLSHGAAAPAIERVEWELGQLVSLVLAVCLALFLTKAFIAYRDLDDAAMPPQICDQILHHSLARIGLCCAEDFAVGLGCLLAGGMALRALTHGGPRRLARFLAHAAAAVAIGYMIVNAQIFHVLRRFLTVELFQVGGGLKPERSIHEYATLPVKLALALAPLLTLALHLVLTGAFPRFWRRAARGLCRPVVLLVLIGSLGGVCSATLRTWFDDHQGDFARSPHLLLARSLFWDVTFGDLGEGEAEVADLDDFLPGRARLSLLPLRERPRNIILVVIESGGSAYFDTYGAGLGATPCLDSLRGRSLTFENFYATANHTIASALPLFGSTYNDPRTIATVVEYPRFPVAGAAAWLRRQGYRTFFLGAGGRLAWEGYRNLAPAFVAHGFDLTRDLAHPLWQEESASPNFLDEDYLDDALFADARRCIRAAGGDRFLLVLWNYETHAPYFAGPGPESFPAEHFPPGLRNQPERREDFQDYLRSLWRLDAQLGDLVRYLEEQGLAEDTLLVVTGDHGEAFGQHGGFAHGGALYEEDVRVPLILVSPRLAPLGVRSRVVGSHIDLWPTVLDVCGLPSDSRWQGSSLLAPDLPKDRRAYFSRRGELGVREGRFKYIWDCHARRELLFDLETDPGERANLARTHPDFCLHLRRRLRDWTQFQTAFTRDRLLEAGEP
jgi:arylsulfatase A-like enzyme